MVLWHFLFFEMEDGGSKDTWSIIAKRSYDLSRRLYQVMLAFCKQKRKGHKRKVEMSLVRRVQCNLTAITSLSVLSFKKNSLYFKFPVGLLLRSCLMDTIYALYFHSMTAKEAEEEIEVLSKDYVKSLDERFEVYKDKIADVGLPEFFLDDIYNSACEDAFIRYLTYEKDDSSYKLKAIKSKEIRTIHDTWPENITVSRMVDFVRSKMKHTACVNRLNSYYKYFSQYEHFSEEGHGDSLAPFGADNVSFPLAIDALEKGLKIIVKI